LHIGVLLGLGISNTASSVLAEIETGGIIFFEA